MIRTKSFLRQEEYRALSGVTLSGRVLDIGGSKKSGYHELLKGKHEIVTANIDEGYGTDLIFDAEKTWPLKDATFDAVLFVNVLEHLYEYRTAVKEGRRVLRSGGVVVGVVPFMFNVHASPYDFFRYTKGSLTRLLTDEGFIQIEVRELGTGAFSVIYHCLMGFVRWNWLATLLIGIATSLDRLILTIKPTNKMSAEYMPLGYFFTAVRSE